MLLVTAVAAVCLCAQPAAQYRGLWVQSWDDGFLTRDQAADLVKFCRRAGFNAIFLQVSKTGDAYYKSDIRPLAENIKEPGYDPLQTVLDLAHDTSGGKPRIEVHAWVVVYRVWKTPSPQAHALKHLPRGHVLALHPDWLMTNDKGQCTRDGNVFIDPGVPAVTEYLARSVREIATRYPVDGIHLDYIRYPETATCEWGYNPVSVRRFRQTDEGSGRGRPNPQSGAWTNWRRRQVTEAVRRMYWEAKAANPKIRVSAATIVWGTPRMLFHFSRAYGEVLQDWKSWLEEGILDFAVPMNYRRGMDRGGTRDFVTWSRLCHALAGKRMVLIGQAAYLNPLSHTADQLGQGLAINPEGCVVYSYQALSSSAGEKQEAFARQVGRKFFASPASVPAMPWIDEVGKGTIAGQLRFEGDKSPEGLVVRIAGTSTKTRTDGTGFFVFPDVRPALYNLELAVQDDQWKPFAYLRVSPGKVSYQNVLIKR